MMKQNLKCDKNENGHLEVIAKIRKSLGVIE